MDYRGRHRRTYIYRYRFASLLLIVFVVAALSGCPKLEFQLAAGSKSFLGGALRSTVNSPYWAHVYGWRPSNLSTCAWKGVGSVSS